MPLALPHIEPLAPTKIAAPFDHDDWLFELKHDGFRCLAYLQKGKPATLVSRTGNVYARFAELAAGIAEALPLGPTVLDGEIVCLDEHGRSQFAPLMRRQARPVFYAFDLLFSSGDDLRGLSLIRRKSILQGLIPMGRDPILVADHVDGRGVGLYEAVCAADGEGIVGKLKESPYELLRGGKSPWVKVLNPGYSQKRERGEWFARKR